MFDLVDVFASNLVLFADTAGAIKNRARLCFADSQDFIGHRVASLCFLFSSRWLCLHD